MEDSLVGRSPSVSDNGAPPRPEGETVDGHAGNGEVSPSTLANSAQDGALTVHPSKEGDDAGGDLRTNESLEIVRATCKVRVDFMAYSQDKKERIKLHRALDQAQRDTATVMNLVTRELWRQDSELLDRFMAEHGAEYMEAKKEHEKVLEGYREKVSRYKVRRKKYKAGELKKEPKKPARPKGPSPWPKPWRISFGQTEAWHMARKAVPGLMRAIAAGASKNAWDKWRKERGEALLFQTRSPPHYRTSTPIPVGRQSYAFKELSPKQYALSFSLRSMGARDSDAPHGHEFTLPLTAKDAHQKTMLHNLAAGTWKPCQLKLVRDRLRPHRWYVTIAYKRLVPRVEGKIAAVNTGIIAFIAAVIEGMGDAWIYDGHDIEAFLKQIQYRRRCYQYDSKASGRGGRGRKRILKPTAPLIEKGERWRKTKCQIVARKLARWFQKHGVSLVYIDGFKGIRDGLPERLEGGKYIWDRVQEWPYYQLQTRLISCLEEYGIAYEVLDSHHISQRCPKCGIVDVKNRNLRYRQLRCVSCGYRRHLDVAAAWNVMARGKGEFQVKGEQHDD